MSDRRTPVAATDDLSGKARTSTDETGAPASRQGGIVGRNAFHLLVGQIASTALSIVFNAVLARMLGAADFGVSFLLMSLANFAYVAVASRQRAYVTQALDRS